MSELSNIKTLSLDKLLADIGGKNYAITSMQLKLQLNAPGTCELVLAQGEALRGSAAAGLSADSLDRENLNAFTPVVVNLYMQGQRTPIVVFRGIVSSVSRVAAKNAAGSYAGAVVNCVMPQLLMSAYNMSGYRYWGTAADGKGKLRTFNDNDRAAILRQLGSKRPLSTPYVDSEPTLLIQAGFAKYITRATGILAEYITRQRFDAESIELHFERRGRTLTRSQGLRNVSFKAAEQVTRNIIAGLTRSDPFTVLRGMYTEQMFINMVPMPCGKMDTIPAFPWSRETVGTLRRSDILQVRDMTSLSVVTENLDAALVPIDFGRGLTRYAQWPKTEFPPASGTAKIVNVPPWLSPYMQYFQATAREPSAKKTNKSTKNTKENIDDKNEQYVRVAELLAQVFFAQWKNSGVAVEASVPWHRLEFLDALGYLIEIEQPIYDRSDQRENLYGYLAGAALKVQSTPGGSQASLQLSFTHVRGESVHDKYAIEDHPLYAINGGPASAIRSFLSSAGRTFTRSIQKSLEGGDQEGYLDEAIAQMRSRE